MSCVQANPNCDIGTLMLVRADGEVFRWDWYGRPLDFNAAMLVAALEEQEIHEVTMLLNPNLPVKYVLSFDSCYRFRSVQRRHRPFDEAELTERVYA